MASTNSSAHEVCTQLEGITVRAVARCISLGTGPGGGSRRNVQPSHWRLSAFQKRLPRFKACAGLVGTLTGCSRLRASVHPLFGNGLWVHRMPFSRGNGAAAATCDRSCGADLDLTLLFAGSKTAGGDADASYGRVGNGTTMPRLDRLIERTLIRLGGASRILAW